MKNTDKKLNIPPIQNPREGWDKAFQRMAANGDDKLLDGEYLANQSSWDDLEWEWEWKGRPR